MELKNKHTFEDDWLAKALIYYQVVDETLYSELSQRFSSEKYFFDVLVKNEYLLPQDIVEFLESALKIPSVNLDQIQFDKKAIEAIPEKLARKYIFIPFQITEKEIFIASFNPTNLACEREIETISGRYVKTFFAFRDKIEEKIDTFYSPDKLIHSLMGDRRHSSKIRIPGESNESNPAPVVKLVNQILADAVDDGASDIHIEPKEKDAHVRIRIDGVLRNLMEIPKSIHPSLMSRIKIISDLNIAETRKPQDGKAKIYVDNVDIDLRVSILPTSFGEKCVIRILDKRKAAVSFDQMGVRGVNRELLETCFAFKQGMVLVTGPTGSGKSTTLYAAINRIKSTANNVLTIEDPVEYVMDGINQVQVNVKAGVTFASALRSFLRQDPDVILVGEIRDAETAEIAIQAAQTGHLVLSTLHTNDTFGTITRLQDMGIDKFKITESLQAIVAQRLVRRLCPACKVKLEDENIDPKLHYMLHQMSEKPQVYEAKGCEKCGFTGYKGRIGVYEILLLDRNLKDKINANASQVQLRRLAKKNGFRNLFEDALSLIADGITDYQEVLRTINVNESDSSAAAETDSSILASAAPTDALKESSGTGVVRKNSSLLQEENEKINVLIVEDYKVSSMMLRKIIEKGTSWDVEEAEDGVVALEKIKKKRPTVILLDIMMPRMDGYELLQHLKASKETDHIPVLILTGLKEPDSEVKGLNLGADDYLTKPINAKVLVARVQKVLAKQKLKMAAAVAHHDSAKSFPQPSPPVAADSDGETEFKLI